MSPPDVELLIQGFAGWGSDSPANMRDVLHPDDTQSSGPAVVLVPEARGQPCRTHGSEIEYSATIWLSLYGSEGQRFESSRARSMSAWLLGFR
jgi:hypothetical protein